jgi:SET domain-containing protein
MLPIRRTGSLLPMPALFAVRDIETGEELTWDYQDAGGESWFYGRDTTNSPSVDEHSTRPCRCGSIACRGYMPYDPSL